MVDQNTMTRGFFGLSKDGFAA